uniref:Uncharacterized protein n=1 Tax=Knipowitschia caucasica TaxID=637954 RepID=A0AAV2JMI6_KNICA
MRSFFSPVTAPGCGPHCLWTTLSVDHTVCGPHCLWTTLSVDHTGTPRSSHCYRLLLKTPDRPDPPYHRIHTYPGPIRADIWTSLLKGLDSEGETNELKHTFVAVVS